MVEAIVRPAGPYMLSLSARHAGDATRTYRDGVFAATFEVDERLERAYARQYPDGRVRLVAASSDGLDRLRFCLAVDDDHSEFLRRFRADPLLGRSTTGGLARVDVTDGRCSVAWTSGEIAPTSVAKVSLANGLVYACTKRRSPWGVSAWYLTAIDARTGKTVWSVRTGLGAQFNNHYSAITLAPAQALPHHVTSAIELEAPATAPGRSWE